MDYKIRAMEPSDIPSITEMLSDSAVFPNTTRQPYNSTAMVEPLFANQQQTHLVVESEGELIASGSLLTEANPRRKHCAELAITVANSWQGKGVGSLLMTALINQADNWLNLLRIELVVYVDNQAAIAMYKKFGFEIEGTRRADAFKDGQYCDSHLMARLSPALRTKVS
ncbi:GNAT family N-acetyltransferase [Corallincola platygyrae]|uniref:GNAT family N-acetyltransferase n=1 Tax=Corallincola platygyrae TaxID=1193278 RepID=A0ABW4XQM2_9GAMM